MPGQGQPWRCMFPQWALPHVNTPVFLMQSAYDVYSTPRLAHEYYMDYLDPYVPRPPQLGSKPRA